MSCVNSFEGEQIIDFYRKTIIISLKIWKKNINVDLYLYMLIYILFSLIYILNKQFSTQWIDRKTLILEWTIK